MPDPGLKISKGIPDDVKKIIIRRQAEIKIDCGCQVSQETTIYKIIRDWDKIKNNVEK